MAGRLERSHAAPEAAPAVQAEVAARDGRLGRFALALFGGAVLLFLCLPIAVVVPMSFSSASSLEFPPPGLSLRWYQSFFGDPRWLLAARNSALIAFVSSLAALVLGSIAAYGLVRGSFRGRALLEGNFVAPLILPPVITAVAVYISFSRIGRDPLVRSAYRAGRLQPRRLVVHHVPPRAAAEPAAVRLRGLDLRLHHQLR
jgi:ABC-type spermidine/putrescine transport system permease subunit II